MEGGTSSTHNDKPESPTTSNTNALPPKRPKKKQIWSLGSLFDDGWLWS